MMSHRGQAAHRLSLIHHHLIGGESLTVTYERHEATSHFLTKNNTASTAANIYVRIGSVSVPLSTPTNNTLVPVGYLFPTNDQALTTAQQLAGLSKQQDVLSTLQFIMKKQILKQDIFLIGPPGPTRRRIAMAYCELMQREVEYLCVSPDVTESDIKQRREIKNKTAIYENAAAVRAALLGRILIIDGIEKAERNVLPVINNLLENREMALEDGRFIVAPQRYEELLALHGEQQLAHWNLIKAHPAFFVIAIGLPVPK